MTKTKNKALLTTLCILLFVFSIFTAIAVNASAAETATTPSASITGKQVNLGGDISMKYYITLADGATIDQVNLKITFLGVETTLEATEDDKVGDEYVFTFKDIPPQCMGDTIYADLLVNGEKVGETLEYSVKQSLTNIYSLDSTTDEMKQLIIDTLDYGAAAQVYADYKANAPVNEDVSFISDDTGDVDVIPESYPSGTVTDGTNTLTDANVLFSYMNFLKFRFTPASIDATVTIGGEAADTWTDDSYFYAQATKGVEPFNFDEKYEVVLGNINLSYSINDYCYAVSQNSNDDNMKALAKALYNYGRSAEALKHAENREHTNVTYVVEGATIHATCPACGNIGSIALVAPESRVYDGTDKVVTYTGEIQHLEAPVVNYEGDRKNVTQDGFTAYILVDGVRVELNVELEKADATVTTAPAAVSNLTYNGSAHALVSAGSATGGKLVYSLSDTGEYTDMIPTGTNAGNYTVWYMVVGDSNHSDSVPESVTVTIAKADASVTTAPAAKTDLVANGSALELVDAGEAEGGTMQYALGNDATTAPTEGWSASIPTGTTAGTYYVWYKVVGDSNHNDVAAQCVTVTISDHVHSWTYSVADNVITATCSGEGTCPNKTVTATITANNGVYTGSAITTVSVTPDANWEGKITIEYQNNVNVGTATAIIKVNDVEVTTVNFEIIKDPKTDEIDGEWVEITP